MQQPLKVQRYRLQNPDVLHYLPPVPRSLEDTGLPFALIQDLVLRRLFMTGMISGLGLSRDLRLPYNGVIDEVIDRMKKDQLVEFTGGPGFGRPYFDYLLTEKGRERARDAMERCAYVGPAPVPLPVYTSLVRKLMRDVPRVGRNELESAFHDLVMEPDFYERLGPAVNSVRSMFLYGAPGNGKTSIAERIASILRGEIFVPYALEVDSQIIQVFDPLIHHEVQPVPDDEADPIARLRAGLPPHLAAQLADIEEGETVEVQLPTLQFMVEENTDGKPGLATPVEPFDTRWVIATRPRVIVGGELTLADLDLTFNEIGRFYEAPSQVKACGGMMLVDDFGRQKVDPTDLLNRWIVPLEKKIDYMTLRTGKKFEVPFDLLIIFSTNLDPAKLVDEAFLRRIRYKLEVPDPSEAVFRRIFAREAERQGVRFSEDSLSRLLRRYYLQTGRRFRSCHPRDILQLVADQARFLDSPPAMTWKLVEQACESYFVHMEGRDRSPVVDPAVDIQSLLR